MDLETAYYALLQAELTDRHERLCHRYGAERVIAPSSRLIETFAELTANERGRGGGSAMRECVQYAGETYEYLVRRWHDPRWRTMMAVALEMNPGNDWHPEEAQPARRRHRPASVMAREMLASVLS